MERYKRDIDVKLTEYQNQYKYLTIKLSDIKTDKDNILLQGVQMKITELFVKSLCKILRIPYKYAQYINADLYEDNINTLISERPDDEMLLCIRNDEELVNIADTTKKNFYLPEVDYVLEGIKIRDYLEEMWWIEDYGYMFVYYGEEMDTEDGSYGYVLKIPMFLADKAITLERVINVEDMGYCVPDSKVAKFNLMVKDKEDTKLPDRVLDRLNAYVDNTDTSFLDGYHEGLRTTTISRENINKVFNKVFKWNTDLLFEFGIEDAEGLKLEKANTEAPTIIFSELLGSLLNVDVNAIGLDVYYKLLSNRWICKMYGKQMKEKKLAEALKEEKD